MTKDSSNNIQYSPNLCDKLDLVPPRQATCAKFREAGLLAALDIQIRVVQFLQGRDFGAAARLRVSESHVAVRDFVRHLAAAVVREVDDDQG